MRAAATGAVPGTRPWACDLRRVILLLGVVRHQTRIEAEGLLDRRQVRELLVGQAPIQLHGHVLDGLALGGVNGMLCAGDMSDRLQLAVHGDFVARRRGDLVAPVRHHAGLAALLVLRAASTGLRASHHANDFAEHLHAVHLGAGVDVVQGCL